MTGQKVMTSNQNKVNIFKMTKGVYMVKVTDKKGISTSKKLIVD